MTGAVRQRSQLSQTNGSDNAIKAHRVSITQVGSEIDEPLIGEQKGLHSAEPSVMQGGEAPNVFNLDALENIPIIKKEVITRADKKKSKFLSSPTRLMKPSSHIINLPPTERPDSRSSMGRFIFDIMRHET